MSNSPCIVTASGGTQPCIPIYFMVVILYLRSGYEHMLWHSWSLGRTQWSWRASGLLCHLYKLWVSHLKPPITTCWKALNPTARWILPREFMHWSSAEYCSVHQKWLFKGFGNRYCVCWLIRSIWQWITEGSSLKYAAWVKIITSYNWYSLFQRTDVLQWTGWEPEPMVATEKQPARKECTLISTF